MGHFPGVLLVPLLLRELVNLLQLVLGLLQLGEVPLQPRGVSAVDGPLGGVDEAVDLGQEADDLLLLALLGPGAILDLNGNRNINFRTCNLDEF